MKSCSPLEIAKDRRDKGKGKTRMPARPAGSLAGSQETAEVEVEVELELEVELGAATMRAVQARNFATVRSVAAPLAHRVRRPRPN